MESGRITKRHKNSSMPAVLKVPEKCIPLMSRMQNFLRFPKSRRWASYEWFYSDIDNGFFNNADTNLFKQRVKQAFPKLKTHNLTLGEWRRIRKLVVTKRRRFSAKFVQDTRIELEKYRRRYRTLQQHASNDQNEIELSYKSIGLMPNRIVSNIPIGSLASACTFGQSIDLFSGTVTESRPNTHEYKLQNGKSTDGKSLYVKDNDLMVLDQRPPNWVIVKDGEKPNQGGQYELYELIIYMRKKLALKSSTLIELKNLNKNAQESMVDVSNSNVTENSVKVISTLKAINNEIMANFDRLWSHRLVKDTLLLASSMPLAPVYFRKKCDQLVFQKHQHNCSESFIRCDRLKGFINTLLKLAFAVVECDKIAVRPMDFFEEFSTECVEKLKMTASAVNFDVFQEKCLPLLLDVITKLCM